MSATSTPALTSLAKPLAPGEGIVILGRTASDDNGIPGCVREALTTASPGTRIVAAEAFRAASGSPLATHDKPAGDEDVGAILRKGPVQTAIAQHAIRYIFFVDGKTEESDFDVSGFMVSAGGNDRTTKIVAAVWDAPSVRPVGHFTVSAYGHPNMILIAFVMMFEYAPTEGTSCARMANDIQRFLASGHTPAGEASATPIQAEKPTAATELEPAGGATASSPQSAANRCRWVAEEHHWQCW